MGVIVRCGGGVGELGFKGEERRGEGRGGEVR